ncbi:unnamed protein product [Closterium sp. Yama58-4]|nr:unnamed protein product [Closterium sp. Yama58-4]
MRFYPTMTAPTGQNVRRGVSLPKRYYKTAPQSTDVVGLADNASSPPSGSTVGSQTSGSVTSGSVSGRNRAAGVGAAGKTRLEPFADPIGIKPWWDSQHCQNSPQECGVMYAPINVYVIWYGKFMASQKEIVRAFTRSLSPSSNTSMTVPLWWNINQQYYDRDGRFISSSVTLAGETDDTGYSRGLMINDTETDVILSAAIIGQKLPFDPNGVYFVLSDETVQEGTQGSGFCIDYCGGHTYTDVPGKGRVAKAWMGNAISQCHTQCAEICDTSLFSISSALPSWDAKLGRQVGTPSWDAKLGRQCPDGCITDLITSSSSSPNRDRGMDGLMSVFAHELAEATSSPYLQTWMDDNGDENADKCGIFSLD